MSRFTRLALVVVPAAVLLSSSLEAACANKYLARQEGVKSSVTLLTGKLTFDEAKALAKAVREKKSAPVAWIDGSGKVIASQVDFDAVRPMPVGCDGKSSGAVLSLTFLRNAPPTGTINVRFTPELVVAFEEQKK